MSTIAPTLVRERSGLDRWLGSNRWARPLLAAGVVMLVLSFAREIADAPTMTSSATFIAAIGASAPILLAGLGGLWSERAGIVNIGLEGMMILGTWFGAWGGLHWGRWGACCGTFPGTTLSTSGS